jgi:hypothetical protein
MDLLHLREVVSEVVPADRTVLPSQALRIGRSTPAKSLVPMSALAHDLSLLFEPQGHHFLSWKLPENRIAVFIVNFGIILSKSVIKSPY